MTPASPTLVEEETQQITPVGMDIEVPEGGQGQQVGDAGNNSHHKNPEESSRGNWIVPNQAKMAALERS
jgi:hypothetical protein